MFPGTKIHPSFSDWAEVEAIPKAGKQERLDGLASGGSLEVFGRFEHKGRTWKVHGDTRIAKVTDAYNAIKSGCEDPFVIEETKNGYCLNLAEQFRITKNPKYFYVYTKL